MFYGHRRYVVASKWGTGQKKATFASDYELFIVTFSDKVNNNGSAAVFLISTNDQQVTP
jgi:hypothetical protein